MQQPQEPDWSHISQRRCREIIEICTNRIEFLRRLIHVAEYALERGHTPGRNSPVAFNRHERDLERRKLKLEQNLEQRNKAIFTLLRLRRGETVLPMLSVRNSPSMVPRQPHSGDKWMQFSVIDC